jgi:hypothetical protein
LFINDNAVVQSRTSSPKCQFEHALDITNDICQCLVQCNLGAKALVIYDRLYQACCHKPTLCSGNFVFQSTVFVSHEPSAGFMAALLLQVLDKQNNLKVDDCQSLLKLCEIACKLGKCDKMKALF